MFHCGVPKNRAHKARKTIRYKFPHKLLRGVVKAKRSLVIILALFIFFIFFTGISSGSDNLADNDVAFKQCSYSQIFAPAHLTTGSEKSIPSYVTHLLQEIEHIFLLCLHECRTTLPDKLLNQSTHVFGNRVDSCAPAHLITGKHVHALKVTFTHAVIMQRALEMRYRHIAVIEDDVLLLQRGAHREMMVGFTRLLKSRHWNLLRFGYRPYFLQEHGAQPCPLKCRCRMDKKLSEHFCHLKSTGCDLRSSDFYLIHSRSFKVFQNILLDIRLDETKRIVDVHPMRSLSNQWLILPQISFQETLDIPLDYQVGSAALFVTKCLHPRPVPNNVTAPLSRAHVWR